jgi:adenylyl-sulfate kinase
LSRTPGSTIWLTGLPGSGKTTIARLLAVALRDRGITEVEVLDGDALRAGLSADLGFDRAGRDEQVRRVAYVCELLNRHGVTAVVSLVSPYERAREQARARSAGMILVHVDCPLPVLLKRDPKGLYRKALAGEIEHFTGIDDPYELPERPDLRLRTDEQRPDECVEAVIGLLDERGYLPSE